MNKQLIILSILTFGFLNSVFGKIHKTNKQKIDTNVVTPVYRNWDRFSLNIGYYLSNNSTGVILGSKALGLGLVINMEQFLSLETNTSAMRANINYTFGKRRRSNLFFDYYAINRKATKVLEAELEILDRTYPVGTVMSSEFNMSIVRAKYEYSFLLDNRISMGVSGGFFIMPIRFSFETTNYSGQSTNMVAPFPIIGLRSEVALTPKFYLNQSAELLYLKIDAFSGSLLDLNIALKYKASKNFGLGVGLNSTRIKISAQGEDYPNIDFFGDIKMEYMGMLLFGSYYF